VVYGNWIEDAGFAGIYMNGYAPGRGGFKSASESYINKGHKIINNFIYDCGKFVGAGCGIQFYQSGDNQILHNRIAKMPRYGISYKGIRFGVIGHELYGTKVSFTNHWDFLHTRNNLIAYNDISNVCQDSFDFGGIETWGGGRDNRWAYNAVHDIAQSVKWDGWAHGLFPDDGCHYHTLYGNIIYALHGGKATGAFMVKSSNQIVENNIVADCYIGHVFTLCPYLEPAVDMVVQRNIIYGPTDQLHMVRESTFKDKHRVKDPTGAMDKFLKDKPVFKTVDYDILWPKPGDLDSLQKSGLEKHAIIADPKFVKRPPFWKVGNRDYQLAPDSPALKAGFKQIPVEKIGLLDDFKFERADIMLVSAGSKLHGESADRILNMRPRGGTDITPALRPASNKAADASWIMYSNLDFGEGEYRQLFAAISGVQSKTPLIELRLDRPDGKLIGSIVLGIKTSTVCSVAGRHKLFLVFKRYCRLDYIRFLKGSDL
jgi:hypothetical protein